MKNAAKTMYVIGRVISIIEIVLTIIAMIIGIILIVLKDEIAQRAIQEAFDRFDTPAKVRQFGIGFLVTGAVFLLIVVVVMVLAYKAQRALNNGLKEEWPHILMIIVGVFGDLFYLLGGVFGLVAESQEANGGNR